MSKSKKISTAPDAFKRLDSIIKEKLICEAAATNKMSKFMNEQEFECEIRQLNSFQISEITQKIGMWYVDKLRNKEIEKISQDNKNISNNEISKQLN